MSHPNPSTALGAVVIDELAVLGTRRVVVSPGSRSGPLAIAASQHPDIQVRVCIDERSAAFVALGAAKASREPAAVICTSGTAVANFLPAVVEAGMSGAPLIAVTADRPAALHGIGANQTIDQREMFDRWVQASRNIPAPSVDHDGNVDWRVAVRDVVAATRRTPPGPGHLNVELSEPLSPSSDDGRTTSSPYEFPTERVDLGRTEARPPDSDQLPRLDSQRGLIVAGDGEYDRGRLRAAADALRWPVLATALSGLRGSDVIGGYADVLDAGSGAGLEPELVVAVGAIGPDPRLEDLVAGADRRVRIDLWGRVNDPLSNATDVIAGDVVELLERASGAKADDFRERWRSAERLVREERASPATRHLNGLDVVEVINDLEWDALFAGSSLPIREIDRRLDRAGIIVANRGASGIDGSVSTSLGVAWAESGRTIAYIGDLAMIHDGNGLLFESDDLDLVIVVADNDGGRIFENLPHSRFAPDFERLFVTPPHRDLADLAAFHRVGYTSVGDRDALAAAAESALDAGGVHIVRVDLSRQSTD